MFSVWTTSSTCHLCVHSTWAPCTTCPLCVFSMWATQSTCRLFVSARGQRVQHAIFLFQHVGNTFNMLCFCLGTWATCSTCYLFVSARGQHIQHAIVLFQHVGNAYNLSGPGQPSPVPPGGPQGSQGGPVPSPLYPWMRSQFGKVILAWHVHFQRPLSSSSLLGKSDCSFSATTIKLFLP